jgi:hypothetical protein
MEPIDEATNSPIMPTMWCVPIPFEVQSVPNGPFVRTNICDLMSADRRHHVYRFDPTLFTTPTTDKETKTNGKKELIRRLQMEAKKASDLSLISSGGKSYTDKNGATFSFALVCACSKVYQSSGEKREDGTARCKSKVDRETGAVIVHDVNNPSSKCGRNGSKRTSTGQ